MRGPPLIRGLVFTSADLKWLMPATKNKTQPEAARAGVTEQESDRCSSLEHGLAAIHALSPEHSDGMRKMSRNILLWKELKC